MTMPFAVSGKLLDACVLGILSKKDTYGYDLTQKITDSMEISESALYPVLRRLSKEGFLTTYDEIFDGRNRKYYKITQEGREKLRFYRENWGIYQAVVTTLLRGGEGHDT